MNLLFFFCLPPSSQNVLRKDDIAGVLWLSNLRHSGHECRVNPSQTLSETAVVGMCEKQILAERISEQCPARSVGPTATAGRKVHISLLNRNRRRRRKGK